MRCGSRNSGTGKYCVGKTLRMFGVAETIYVLPCTSLVAASAKVNFIS